VRARERGRGDDALNRNDRIGQRDVTHRTVFLELKHQAGNEVIRPLFYCDALCRAFGTSLKCGNVGC
jgi:hypothetical protein